MNSESNLVKKLGMFVIIGLTLFVITIYFIGKQKNLFSANFHLRTQFKTVGGLKVGNNVRFSGINVGTIDDIKLITDTSVIVDIIIQKQVQQFIKSDATASICTDGLMGDKVLTIFSGTYANGIVKDNAMIGSKNAIEIEDLMISLKSSVDNVAIITSQVAKFSSKLNNGNGALSKLISDEAFANSLKVTLINLEKSSDEFARFTVKMNNGKGALSKMVSDEKFGAKLDSAMTNLQSGTKNLNETIDAAQHNFLLKGYFNSKKKREAKNLKIQTELKMKDSLNKAGKLK